MLLDKKTLFAVRKAQEFKIKLRDGEHGPREVLARKLNAREALELQATINIVAKDVTDQGELLLRVSICYAMYVLIDETGERMFDPRIDSESYAQASEIDQEDVVDIYLGYIAVVNPKTDDEVKEQAKNSEGEADQNSSGSVSAESLDALTPTS